MIFFSESLNVFIFFVLGDPDTNKERCDQGLL